MSKQTPIYNEHLAAGAKMVEFAGWKMPVEYTGIRAEHNHVRSQVGLFDVSHMGEIRVRGPKALETLQWITTNDVSKLSDGQAQYSLLPNEQGGLIDDLIVYCLKKNADYLVCVNAANSDKDWDWFQNHNRGADLTNESSQWGQIAVQGPHAIELMKLVFSDGIESVKPFHFDEVEFQGSPCLVARTGYTGEDGFEVFVPWAKAAELWRALLRKESDFEAKPIGLGARDTLRTEMKYSLYGQEIDSKTNPYAAGLGWAVKPNVKDFIGRGPMMRAKEDGLAQKLVGFKMIERGIARHDYKIVSIDNNEIGRVTSGTVSPTLNENIGIGYVDVNHSAVGSEIFIDIRGKRVKALVVPTPFVSTSLTKKS